MSEVGGGTGLLLLDTHVWIWAFHGEADRFSRTGVDRIAEAADQRMTRVSAISVWEVARLIKLERISTELPVDAWISRARTAFSQEIIAISGQIALESTRLPGLDHKDPADRFLIATARAIGARLVTVDDIILAYGETGHLEVLDPRK